jgi:hypothetical protein
MRYSQIRQGVITNSAGSKATLSDADEFAVSDSQDSSILKKVTWALINSAVATLRNKTILGAKVDSLFNVNGSKTLELWTQTNGVNNIGVEPGIAGRGPMISSDGSDTNVALTLRAKAAGAVNIASSTNGVMLNCGSVANGVNYVKLFNAAAGSAPYLAADGADANQNFEIWPKGTGVVRVRGVQVETKGHTHTAADVAGAAQWITTPPTAANSPGTAGQLCHSAGFLYVCVATNTWVWSKTSNTWPPA